jgi:hypothetical protein
MNTYFYEVYVTSPTGVRGWDIKVGLVKSLSLTGAKNILIRRIPRFDTFIQVYQVAEPAETSQLRYLRVVRERPRAPRQNPYRISLREFLREHREELDEAIQRVAPGAPRNDYEREMWVRNDEGLYNWARSEGVRL